MNRGRGPVPAQAQLLEHLNPGARLHLASAVHGPVQPEPRQVVLCSLWPSSQAPYPPPCSISYVCGKKQRAGNIAENVRRSKASNGGSQVRAKKQGHSLGSHRQFQGFFTPSSWGVRSTETRGSKAKGANSQGLTVAMAVGGLGEEVSNPGRLGPNRSCQTHSESQIPASGA